MQAQAIIEEMRLYTGRMPYLLANRKGDAYITKAAAYKVMKNSKIDILTTLYYTI